MSLTDRLTQGVQSALVAAGLPPAPDCAWEVPRQAEHGDYATNVAMTHAKTARRAPRQIADAIVKHFPPLDAVARLEIAGPGFLNVFLSPAWVAASLREVLAAGGASATERLGRWAVARMVEGQRRVLADYGVTFDVWSSEQHDVRDRGLADKILDELKTRGLTYEQDGALWFRATEAGEDVSDDKDRVLRRSAGGPTYFAVDIAYHHYVKFAGADRLINLLGPDHHGYVARIRAAMQALGHPPEAFEVLIVQLVTLLRDGQPVRMSKRRGEFVLMEELLEEVGRDAARFTFLTRRHDSPLEFGLAVATRQSNDNPVYYVQYAHARIRSIFRQP